MSTVVRIQFAATLSATAYLFRDVCGCICDNILCASLLSQYSQNALSMAHLISQLILRYLNRIQIAVQDLVCHIDVYKEEGYQGDNSKKPHNG